MFKINISFLFISILSFTSVSAFTTCPIREVASSTTKIYANNNDLSRSKFMNKAAIFGASSLFIQSATTQPASAKTKEIDPALKGTKADPEYQTCVSQCMYDCTKPKGDEQKSRAECLPECKKQCASTKAQLMVGTPK